MMRALLLVSILAFATSVVQADDPREAPRVPDTPVAGPHKADYQKHRFAPTSPDLLEPAGQPVTPPLLLAGAGDPCATVFGYLPYWESSANIQWDLITHVACFSVEVNADGSLGSDHGWPWTSVISAANANGVKVVLVATLFDGSDILTLITNPTYKNTFFVNIRNKMNEGPADGLNIDFEGGSSWQGYINDFMADLTAYIHTEIPGSEVTFAGPAVNWGGVWDLFGLADSCDGIFIMGYNYYWSGSSTSGPNSPLTGGSINITDTVLDEYYPATQIIPEKLILGVPYYGLHWTTTSSAARSSVIAWQGSTRFRDDQPNSVIYGRQWETLSQTPWYRWHDGSDWHQVWYDDAESLGLKYDLAKDNDLQGVGMWALNYDGTRTELWDELEAQFVDACCEDEVTTTGVVVFDDDFDAGTSGANWDLYTSSSDYTANFAYDYSAYGIPSAPNSQGGTTVGVRFTVNNNDANADTEALSAYPTGQSFGDNYALKFDMWINYGGGSGTTEFMMAGINASGTQVNWPENASADGYTFGVDGEGGSSRDYRAYDGPSEYSLGSGVYVANSQNSTDALYQRLFPNPEYETQGAPGKHWIEVDIRQVDDSLEWRLNGTRLAVVTSPSVASGNVMIGYMDPFTSIANPAADNFIVYDNVRVVQLPEKDCNDNGVADACEPIDAGDYDADGTVNLNDYSAFADCLSGPNTAPTLAQPMCAHTCLDAFDFDEDLDVDFTDFAAFHAAFEG